MNPLLPFAKLDHRLGRDRVVSIRANDLGRHLAIVGRSGEGKSVLIEHLLLGEIRAGRGVSLLDPHGDLAERILERIPKHRRNDVVVFDPADVGSSPSLNPLDARDIPSELVVSGVLSVFRKTFADAWGPRTEHLCRHILQALIDVPQTTLLSASRMLTDAAYRDRIVERVKDPLVQTFWTKEFATWPKAFLAEVQAPLQNKLGAFLTHPILRAVLGQPHSSIRLETIMDSSQIFVANLSKGRLGEDGSSLLGSLILSLIQLAAFRRANTPPDKRRPFTVYVDEFPSFATDAFAGFLEESRKYNVAMVLAWQHAEQLHAELRGAVLGNVGSLIVFRVRAQDGEELALELGPGFTPHDLASLGRHQIALKIAIDGVTSPAFTAVTLPPEDGDSTTRDVVKRLSRERYTRSTRDVDALMKAGLGLGRIRDQARRGPLTLFDH